MMLQAARSKAAIIRELGVSSTSFHPEFASVEAVQNLQRTVRQMCERYAADVEASAVALAKAWGAK